MLRRADINSGFAKELIAQAGNANAIGGGSKEQFSRIMLALGQMALKPYLSGEELMQLNEAGIGASKMVRDKFGTSDGEELKSKGITSAQVLTALLEAMEKMPRVAGGAQNSLDNFTDAIHFAMVNLGSGLQFVGPGLDSLSDTLTKFTDAGIWADAIQSFLDNLGLIPDSTNGVEEAIIEVILKFNTLGQYLKKFTEGLKLTIDTIGNMSPLKNLFDLLTQKDNNGQRSQVGDFLAEAYGFKFNDEDEANLRLKLASQAQKPKPQKDPVDPLKDPLKDPNKEVASNTAKLVELQKDNNKLAQMLLGGGAVTSQAFSQVNITKLQSHGGTKIERAVRVLVAAVHDEISNSGDAWRSSNPLRA